MLSAVVGLSGASIGGFSSYLVARQGVGGQAAADRRRERIGAYSDFLLKAGRYAEASNDATDHKSPRDLLPGDISPEEKVQLSELGRELGQAIAVVELVGSRSAVDAVREFSKAVLLLQFYSDPVSPDDLERVNDNGIAAIERFREEARRDLSSDKR